MAVNPAIAMGVQPLQLTDPLTQYGRFAAIQQAQNQNALAQYQLGAARREEASQNALNEAYRAAYDPQTGAIDMNRLRQTLSTGGFGSKLPGIEKSMADMEEQRLKRDAAKTALVDVKLKQARSFLDTIDPADPSAPEKFMAWHEANHRDPVLGPVLEARGVTADQSRGRIQQAIQQGPQAFAQLLLQSKVGTEKFMEMNRPKSRYMSTPYGPFDPETGEYKMPESLPARAPAPAPTAPIRLRPGETLVSPAGEAITSMPPAPPRVSAARGGAVAPGAPAAKPPTAAQAAKTEAQAQARQALSQDLQTVLGYYNSLNKMGAMTSPERSIGENVLASARATGLGQEAERTMATQAQTLRDNISNSRQRLLVHIKNATGASAQQMNSNVELQTWLNALTNPRQSIETVRETLGQLDSVIASVQNQVNKETPSKSTPAPASAAPLTPAEQAELDALRQRFGSKRP